jgi:RimJ/RimL family protein N-acetyltransferase
MTKKFGYKLEGKRRKSDRSKSNKKYHDINLYGLFKKDWIKAKKRLKKK